MTFTSLWVGDHFPVMSQLSCKSYLDHGHDFQLFTYTYYDNIPKGVKWRNAREILPEEDIFRDASRNGYATFSDWFRMKWLYEEGGFWVDMDTVCLTNEVPTSEIYTCRQDAHEVAVGGMRFPQGHDVPKALAEMAADPAVPAPWNPMANRQKYLDFSDIEERRRNVPWGFCGPSGLTRVLRYYKLYDQSAEPAEMYPIHFMQYHSIYNGQAKLTDPCFSKAWNLHLWGNMVRERDLTQDDVAFCSIYAELLNKHLPQKQI